jgi:hypothetical protein
MRRTVGVLILTTLVTGCSALQGALPSHSGAVEATSGMTVEQYAIGRLRARPPHAATCPTPAHTSKSRAAQPAKRCPK